MRKESWIVFYAPNGKELCSFTVRGMGENEISEARKLLAYEKHMNENEIYFKEESRYDEKTKEFSHTTGKTKLREHLGYGNIEGNIPLPDLDKTEGAAYLIVRKGFSTLMPTELAWYLNNGYTAQADSEKNKYKLNKLYLKDGQREKTAAEMRTECGMWTDAIKAIDSLYTRGMVVLFDKDRVHVEDVERHDNKDVDYKW